MIVFQPHATRYHSISVSASSERADCITPAWFEFRSARAQDGLLPTHMLDSVYIDRNNKHRAKSRDMRTTSRQRYGRALCRYDLVDPEAACNERYMCGGRGRVCDSIYGGAVFDHTRMGMSSPLLVLQDAALIRSSLLDTHTSKAVLWVSHLDGRIHLYLT